MSKAAAGIPGLNRKGLTIPQKGGLVLKSAIDRTAGRTAGEKPTPKKRKKVSPGSTPTASGKARSGRKANILTRKDKLG